MLTNLRKKTLPSLKRLVICNFSRQFWFHNIDSKTISSLSKQSDLWFLSRFAIRLYLILGVISFNQTNEKTHYKENALEFYFKGIEYD